MDIKIVEAGLEDKDTITQFFKEYAAELQEDLCFQGFRDELENPFIKYRAPGCILLGYYKQQPAGCIALKPINAQVCEMKRLYVPPASRAHGLGLLLVEKLIDIAQQRGFNTMVLDTLQRLQPAIRLYGRLGFIPTTPYYANPLPGVIYMQKEIRYPADQVL